MIKKISRLILALLGAGGGVALADLVINYIKSVTALTASAYVLLSIAIYACLTIGFGIIVFIFSPAIINWFLKVIRIIENKLSAMPLSELFLCILGLLIGLGVAYLLSGLMLSIPGKYLPLLANFTSYATFCSLGIVIIHRRKSDISLPAWLKRKEKQSDGAHAQEDAYIAPKLLDTSAIIDGRIRDISVTGFIEGALVVPAFVLDELRHIADSADLLKRNRGRRGLDMLKAMQTDAKVAIHVENKDYDDILEVDAKLVRLALDLRGTIITTDYNLNKVAAVQRVPVLNINDLANAIKSVLLPGEELTSTVVKEGKEYGQGLAYLPDGTMIVIENGKDYIGNDVRLCVTSVLQTSAGRMVFAKLAEQQ